MTQHIYRYLHPLIAVAGFGLWAYLLIVGRELHPTTTFAILLLILATAGFAQLASDLLGAVGGGGSGNGGGGGGNN